MFTVDRFCACWPGILSLIVPDDPPETDILLKIKKEPADTHTTGKRYFNRHSWLGWVKALDFWFQGCWCSLSCCPASILRLRSCYWCWSYFASDMCRDPKTGSKIQRILRQNSLTGSKSPGTQGCGAGAGAAGADTFWSEPEPEPPKRFARSRSRNRSRKKRGGSGSERNTIVEK